MKKESWKQIKLDYLTRCFGDKIAEYKASCDDDGWYHDDRGVYVASYEQIIEAIQSLPDEPNNYVCCAMNQHIKEDLEILSRIRKVFDAKGERK